jgi:hypothetical protein
MLVSFCRFTLLFSLLIAGSFLTNRAAIPATDSKLEVRQYDSENHPLIRPFACPIGAQESEVGKEKDESQYFYGSFEHRWPIFVNPTLSVDWRKGRSRQWRSVYLLNQVFRN